MRVLVVGNGAREHAIAWKFSQSNRVSGLFVAPGNAGTASLGENLPDVSGTDLQAVVRASVERRVNLVFVGPEVPLSMGLVDALSQEGIAAIGPAASSARLESSKAFSKQFMIEHGIPTARFDTYTATDELISGVQRAPYPVVVKKSGLAAGKGVVESDDPDVLIQAGTRFIAEGDSVVVEERLTGFEISLFGLSDGRDYVILPPCTDYKKAGVGGAGPNTGGMGAICPVPWLSNTDLEAILKDIVAPTYAGLHRSGLSYTGILYFGVMVTQSGPKLLEYNVRFGDPEAQTVLPLIQNDFVNLVEAMTAKDLARFQLGVSSDTAVGVVVASPGYPSEYPKDLEVTAMPGESSSLVFHASTTSINGILRTGGGRCFTAVGRGSDILTARQQAYALAREIQFEGSWFRPDIGGRIFG